MDGMFYQDNLIAYKTSKMENWKFIIPQEVLMTDIIKTNLTGEKEIITAPVEIKGMEIEGLDENSLSDEDKAVYDEMKEWTIPKGTKLGEQIKSDIKVDVRKITGKELESAIKEWKRKK